MTSEIDTHFARIRDRLALPDVRGDLVLLVERGSVAHGTYVAPTEPQGTDDVDYLGVFVGDRARYLGLRDMPDTVEIQDGALDVVCYEFRRFVRLLVKGNPNVLSSLWTTPIFTSADTGRRLIADRRIFVGTHILGPFVGYADAMLKRMERGAFAGYMGARRRENFARFGFDCKNAAHLIRLLRMAVEFFDTGEFVVWRPDAADLIAIKQGRWTKEAVFREADCLRALAHEAKARSRLPEGPDFMRIDALVQEILGEACQEDRAQGASPSLVK